VKTVQVTDRDEETMTLHVELHPQEGAPRTQVATIGRIKDEHPGKRYRFWFDPGPNRWRWAREGFADDGIGLPHHGSARTLKGSVRAACLCEADDRTIPDAERSPVGGGSK